METKPKILILDVENSPNLAYVWGLWEQTINEGMVENSWFMLSWAAKFLGEKKIYSDALINHPREYKKNPEDDKPILQELWKLMDESDIILGHNIDAFDCRKINARFIMNGMTPPSPYKTIDTLKISRKYFFFTSNKLNDLSKYLKIGEKVKTGGFELWQKCIRGDKNAWKTMIMYNIHDVRLTEQVYLKLRPYMEQHPNLNVYMDINDPKCPKCSSQHVKKEGFYYTATSKFQRYSCLDCKGWFRDRINLLKKKGK